MGTTPFLSGVIEGFYGRPWTASQRGRLLGWMQQWGLNTYFHAPKDDLKHRVLWRLPYSRPESEALQHLIRTARRAGVRFIHGLSPGLDMVHSDPRDQRALRRKLNQLLRLGVRHFALLFDDIPAIATARDRRRFSSIAAAHVHTTNRFLDWLRSQASESSLLFCPTPYCELFAGNLETNEYLRQAGESLHPDIPILWTGPEIISETISTDSIRRLRSVIRRRPVLWDNLQANDYDFRRLHLGPYSGRTTALLDEVQGILANPNCEFEANYVPLHTLARFVNRRLPWNPRDAYQRALRDWLPEWRTVSGRRFTLREIEFIADCFHLPTRLGPRAETWLADYRFLLRETSERNHIRSSRFIRTSTAFISGLKNKLPLLANRDLLHALYPRLGELKQEMEFALRHLDQLHPHRRHSLRDGDPVHPPGIFRGGLTAALQNLLPLTAASALTTTLQGQAPPSPHDSTPHADPTGPTR
jgi:protein O-GlcNAcase/histone acetyltransferase